MAIFIGRQGREFIEFHTAQQCDIFVSRRQKQYFLYSTMPGMDRNVQHCCTLLKTINSLR